jgi:phosphate:Na+ symporter
LPFFTPFTHLVTHTAAVLPRQIANAHTIFNIAVSALLFPFVGTIAWAARRLVPEKEEEKETKLTAFIDSMQYSIPAVALKEAQKELVRMGEMTAQMIDQSSTALIDHDLEAANWVIEQEQQFVDPITDILENFVNRLMQENLSLSQQKRCFQLKNLLTDVERVGDLTEDLAEAAKRRVNGNTDFSPAATRTLEHLCRHTHQTFSLALQALHTNNHALAEKACRMEDEFDHLYLDARQAHIERLDAGTCHPEADVLFTETLRNLERISDHADNVGISTMRSIIAR